ncbi:hypothetical protein [Mucilaginibacter sp.]
MKTFIVKIMLLPISLLAACNSKSKQIKDFIPGTYVNFTKGEYSICYDTLHVIPDALTENFYHISQRTGFRRIINGKLQAKMDEIKSFNGLWDEQKQIFQFTQNERILIFQPGGNRLMMGNNAYRKL